MVCRVRVRVVRVRALAASSTEHCFTSKYPQVVLVALLCAAPLRSTMKWR